MEMYRLFIAINLPADLLQRLTQVQQQLQRRLANYPLRWSRPEGIHLTLKFLGDTNPARIPEITSALHSLAQRHESFELGVGGLGMFPNTRRPSVLWIGVNDSEHHLRRLAADVDKTMARLGWQKEKRPFAAHLTLARVKKNAGNRERRQLGEVVASLQGYTHLGKLPIHSFQLMRSQLHPAGAIYTTLSTIPMGVSKMS